MAGEKFINPEQPTNLKHSPEGGVQGVQKEGSDISPELAGLNPVQRTAGTGSEGVGDDLDIAAPASTSHNVKATVPAESEEAEAGKKKNMLQGLIDGGLDLDSFVVNEKNAAVLVESIDKIQE